jgi:transposase-like protein
MKRRVATEWRRLIRNWEESGVNQADYCKRQGVALSTFQHWRKKLQNSSEGSFLELVPAVSEQEHEIELELPHGIILRVKG